MLRRITLSVAGVAAVVLSTSGCIQLGEYAMGGECEDLSNRVVRLVQDMYGEKPGIDDMWAGESDIWCSFDVLTGVDRSADDPQRIELTEQVRELITDVLGDDVRVTIVYPAGEDEITT